MNQSTLTRTNPAAVLWASAFVLAALIVVQLSRSPGNAAFANMATDRGSYTLMTSSSGRGPDLKPYELLYVIDSREQMLLLYEVEDARKKQITLREGYNLDAQFQLARR